MDTTAQPSARNEEPAESGLAGFFHFRERGTNLGTEARAGLTTFMVMAYIIFLNGEHPRPPARDGDPTLDLAVAAGTALVAGIMTIAMGVVANYPFALAAGLGINAIVAFSLTGQGLSTRPARWASSSSRASSITVARPRRPPGSDHERRAARAEAGDRRRHRPVHPVHRLRQRRADRRRAPSGDAGRDAVLVPDRRAGQFVFLLGLLITIVLYVLKIRAALIISILRHHGHRPHRRRRDDPDATLVAHAELRDARPVRPRPGLQPSSAASRRS